MIRILVALTALSVLFAIRRYFTLDFPLGPVVVFIVLAVLYCEWDVVQLQIADHAFQEGNVERAVVLYTRAIDARPDEPHRYLSRALAYYYLGDFPKAITDYNRAISLDSKVALAWSGRAMARGQIGEIQGAIDDATVAICLAPETYEALLARGYAYHCDARFEEAYEDLVAAICVAPHVWQAYDVRAWTLLQLKQYESALEDFLAAAERNGRPSQVRQKATVVARRSQHPHEPGDRPPGRLLRPAGLGNCRAAGTARRIPLPARPALPIPHRLRLPRPRTHRAADDPPRPAHLHQPCLGCRWAESQNAHSRKPLARSGHAHLCALRRCQNLHRSM